MARPQALKAHRKSLKRRARNRLYKGMMRDIIKRIRKSENKEEALKLLPRLYATVDRVASKGIIHKNTAARYKSRLTKFVNSL